MTLDLDALEALEKKARMRARGKLYYGTAGNADLVAFNQEDITGIAFFGKRDRVEFVAAVCNEWDELLRLARIGQRVERDAKRPDPMSQYLNEGDGVYRP